MLTPLQLAWLAGELAEQDQGFVPDHLESVLLGPESRATLERRLEEFFDYAVLAAAVDRFIATNSDRCPVEMIEPPAAYSLVLALPALREPMFARQVMRYAVGLAFYEWQDRRRGSTPFDEERDGPIRLLCK